MNRKLKAYYRKQKILGLGFMTISVLSIFIEMDGTFALIGVPAGLWMMLTKKKFLTDSEIETDFD